MYLKSPAQLKRLGVKHLPRNLQEAVDALDRDPLTEAVMGKAMKTSFVDFKRTEWDEYHNHVSDWERARYLRFY